MSTKASQITGPITCEIYTVENQRRLVLESFYPHSSKALIYHNKVLWILITPFIENVMLWKSSFSNQDTCIYQANQLITKLITKLPSVGFFNDIFPKRFDPWVTSGKI